MISKKIFLAAVEKLNCIFPDSAIPNDVAKIYYETMSPDFTDEEFTAQLNFTLKNSFKFPPIAAFYKENPEALKTSVYDPVTKKEAENIRKVWEREGIVN